MKKPYMMPYEGKNVPHAVLEVNQKCNIECKACYKSTLNYTKSVEEVKKEVDALMVLRNLRTITLAGGEPTLHPQLPDIIRYIVSRNINVMMLSNGTNLSDTNLKAYKEAGLSEILLHVDSNQKRPDVKEKVEKESDLNWLRTEIGKKIVAHGMMASIELTLYKNRLAELPEIVRYFLETPLFVRLLITCCHDFEGAVSMFRGGEVLGTHYHSAQDKNYKENEFLQKEAVSVKDVEDVLQTMGMEPYSYVASSADDNEKRWISYISFTIDLPDGTVKTLHADASFGELNKKSHAASRAAGKPYSFAEPYPEETCMRLCKYYALNSGSLKTMWKTFLFLLNKRKKGAVIRLKAFIFQQGPETDKEGNLVTCKFCPDATIRDGKLVPVCLVDLLHPDSYAQYKNGAGDE